MNTMTTTTVLLQVTDVVKKFVTPQGPLTILEHASLTVKRGEKIAIVGPSGSGKSTLLALIGLLDTPTTGSIVVDGINIQELDSTAQARFRNEHIGFVFQSFELIEPFTVTENIEAPLLIRGGAVDAQRIDTLIQRVGLTARTEALPHTLSGGEKQRVAIARALVNRPTLILADEPTGSLDRATGGAVLDLLLEQVASEGSTLIIITHDEEVAKRVDRVYELRDRVLHERV